MFDREMKLSKCTIDNCSVSVHSDHLTNLKKHLQQHHKSIYEEIIVKQLEEDSINQKVAKKTFKTVKLRICERDLNRACIDLASRGCPYRIFDTQPFRQISFPNLKAANSDTMINSLNLKRNNQ